MTVDLEVRAQQAAAAIRDAVPTYDAHLPVPVRPRRTRVVIFAMAAGVVVVLVAITLRSGSGDGRVTVVPAGSSEVAPPLVAEPFPAGTTGLTVRDLLPPPAGATTTLAEVDTASGSQSLPLVSVGTVEIPVPVGANGHVAAYQTSGGVLNLVSLAADSSYIEYLRSLLAAPPVAVDINGTVGFEGTTTLNHMPLIVWSTRAGLVAMVVGDPIDLATAERVARAAHEVDQVAWDGRLSETQTGSPSPGSLLRLFAADQLPSPGDLTISIDGATATVSVTTKANGFQDLCVTTTLPSTPGNTSMCAAPAQYVAISAAGTTACATAPVFVVGLTVPDAQQVTVDNGSGATPAQLATSPGFPATLFMAKVAPPAGPPPRITVTKANGQTLDNGSDANHPSLATSPVVTLAPACPQN